MQETDDDFGVSSGWETLDAYYKVVPGELTIVTGVPNSGKARDPRRPPTRSSLRRACLR